MTFNEPHVTTVLGYRIGIHAPGIKDTKQSYQAAYNQMLAHGKAYAAIKANDSSAKVGITNASQNFYSLVRDEKTAALIEFQDADSNGLYLEPLFLGTYPQIILDTLGKDAPRVNPDDLKVMRHTDFVGVQYYTDTFIRPQGPAFGAMGTGYDFHDYTEVGWAVTPMGLYEHLMHVATRYKAQEIMVTENGSAWQDVLGPDGKINDVKRQDYLVRHVAMVHRAIQDGAPVTGYFAWSFMDNYEWAAGYRPRFGLVYTEYASQRRIVKDSGFLYRDIMRANGLQDSYDFSGK